ncbi:MAG: phosphoribosylamine--glycine ligase [bacterium]|nr:phosphoribosylamine--glycine ligase [bacterium]
MAEKVLIVGNGGREHELGRQIDQSVQALYYNDMNAGIEQLSNFVHNPSGITLKSTDLEGIAQLAKTTQSNLVVIGPEAPLIAGLSDILRHNGHNVFGPSAEAAQLEGSKAWAVEFMRRNQIPHPSTAITYTAEEAFAAIRAMGGPENIVIKADGQAGGKGVVLPEETERFRAWGTAQSTVFLMFSGEAYSGAGKDKVLISERYHGPEASVFVVSDSKNFIVLPYFAQDHKRLLDDDKGPNTGGMGAYAPLPKDMLSLDQTRKIYDIAERSISGMASEGIPYQGVLFMGLMMAEELDGDPAVIEYNIRFGDPETQVTLPTLAEAGVDVYELLRSSAEGRLRDISLPSNLGYAALTFCLAARGYPNNPEKGQTIYGLDTIYPNVIIHHAGTKRFDDGVVKTTGGRVLCVTGMGKNLNVAAEAAYNAVGFGKIDFSGAQYRRDIGHQAR